jgi:hypothetical protein
LGSETLLKTKAPGIAPTVETLPAPAASPTVELYVLPSDILRVACVTTYVNAGWKMFVQLIPHAVASRPKIDGNAIVPLLPVTRASDVHAPETMPPTIGKPALMHVGHPGVEAAANGIAEAAAMTGIDQAAPFTTARRLTPRGDRFSFSSSDMSVAPIVLLVEHPSA